MLENTANNLYAKTWGLELTKWDNERGIILPKGTRFIRSGDVQDGPNRDSHKQVNYFG